MNDQQMISKVKQLRNARSAVERAAQDVKDARTRLAKAKSDCDALEAEVAKMMSSP